MTIYLGIYLALSILLLLGAIKSLRSTKQISGPAMSVDVSIIFPIHGASQYLENNLKSWLDQNYEGKKQFIFSLQDQTDPALNVLKELSKHYTFEVTVNPVRSGFSGKGSNLYYGLEKALHSTIIFSDSDILAEPQTLNKIIGLIQNSKTLVSCLPVHTSEL